MKSLKMLMMAALSILTISVFAQSNTTISKKEQMKMEVMKIYTSPGNYDVTINNTGNYAPGSFASNLSSKEQMKIGVMKLNAGTHYNEVAIDKSAMCTKCVALSNLAPKEQMKMKVMGLYNCPMSADMSGNMSGKCSSMCGMDLTAAKSK
jgi:hypothetical protein